MGGGGSKAKAKAAAKAEAEAAANAKAAAPRTDSAIERDLAAVKAAAFEALEKREKVVITRISELLLTEARLKGAYKKSLDDNEISTVTDSKHKWERATSLLIQHQEELNRIHNDMEKVVRMIPRYHQTHEHQAMVTKIEKVVEEMMAKLDNTRPDNFEADTARESGEPTAKEQARADADAAQAAAGDAGVPPPPPAAGMPQVPTGEMDVAAANASKQASYNNMLGVAS